MPREQHIERQVHWKNKLQEYGENVQLEKTVYIKDAPVIVDVYAEIEEKIFLIEIGDIVDKRKIALMQYYAELNPNIHFIHEDYGADKIQQVLESITAYLNSPEYRQLIQLRLSLEKQSQKFKLTKKRKKRRELYALIATMLVPTFALFVVNVYYAVFWFGFWFFIIFIYPFGALLLGETGPSNYVMELIDSLNAPKDSTKSTEN